MFRKKVIPLNELKEKEYKVYLSSKTAPVTVQLRFSAEIVISAVSPEDAIKKILVDQKAKITSLGFEQEEVEDMIKTIRERIYEQYNSAQLSFNLNEEIEIERIFSPPTLIKKPGNE